LGAAVGMQSSPQRSKGPSPKHTIRGKDCSPPHADATNVESRPLGAYSEDLVQGHGHCRHRRNTYCPEGPVGNQNANSHTQGRRRRRHTTAFQIPPKEDGTNSVGSQGGPLLLEGTTDSGRNHSTSCLLPKPSRSGKPARWTRHQGQNSGPPSPPPPGNRQHVLSSAFAQKGKAALGSHGGRRHCREPIGASRSAQGEQQCKTSNCETEHRKMTHVEVQGHSKATPRAVGAAPVPAVVVKHKLKQASWRPSVMCMPSRWASAQDVTMTPPAEQEGVEGLPHASWRPSLLNDRTPAVAATASVAKPYRGGMAVAQIGVHGVC